MYRIRLHGRGGQGIKTASQILGTAAFYSGYQAQDFPLYGAERRGAPIVAFTRISEKPVLERGPISSPDIILVGDETLLDDPQAAPLCGADESTAVFINSTLETSVLQQQLHLSSSLLKLNLTELCIQHLNKGTVLSTALAAAGARLVGMITLEALLKAVDAELSQQGIGSIQENLNLTKEIFQNLFPVVLKPRKEKTISPSEIILMEQANIEEAAPIILSPGNMILRKTGNWRVQRPEIDYEHCNHCLICYARCPDGAISLGPDDKPEIDYDHCKGCLICAQECPGHFINTVREAGVES